MGRITPILPLIALGCAEPVDPTEALLDFAEAMSEEVYDGLWSQVDGREDLDLWALESSSYSGELALGAAQGVQGELSGSWSLSYAPVDHGADEVRVWLWDVELEIASLDLPCCEVAGHGGWTVEHQSYDYSWQQHGFVGELIFDGGEPTPVELEALHSGNLHWVRGTVGETEVDWENPDADSC
jgi:hypothetical protein